MNIKIKIKSPTYWTSNVWTQICPLTLTTVEHNISQQATEQIILTILNNIRFNVDGIGPENQILDEIWFTPR